MATNVIKRNGTVEPFDAEKMKSAVRAAATEAGIAAERMEEIVEQAVRPAMEAAEQVEEIETSVLRDKILAALDDIDPSISDAWRKYNTANKE